MAETSVGCERPTAGVEKPEEPKEKQNVESKPEKGAGSMIGVGHKAPGFEAPAYHNGNFTSVKLSDYLGKWVVLCFYPGDFTFV